MENVKVKKSLIKKIEITAKKMQVSTDSVVSMALEDFFEREQNKDLLKQINEAYKEEPTAEEKRELNLIKQKQAKVLDEWK